jgi:glycosyltransferase involved in cell wall biosynthesis
MSNSVAVPTDERGEMRFVGSLDDYVRDRLALTCESGGRSLGRRRSPERGGLVTVVTVAFNSAATLARTLDSVAAQTYSPIEHIVIDGGSVDGTVDLLRKRENLIDLWLSEADRGISDAFNKGISLASGEFIALVNSDDWVDPDHMERAVECLRRTGADFVFGNLMVHDADGRPQYLITGDPAYERRIRHSMPALSHPSVVCRREAYARCGLFDTRLRIAMDYDWLLRGFIAGLSGAYVPQITSHMSGGGVSHLNGRKGLKEVRQISVRHGYPPVLAWIRFAIRACRLSSRLFLERWVSVRIAQRVRRWIHPAYRPCGDEVPTRD